MNPVRAALKAKQKLRDFQAMLDSRVPVKPSYAVPTPCLLTPEDAKIWHLQQIEDIRAQTIRWEGKTVTVLQVAWMLAGNPPAPKLYRRCGNPLCTNLEHVSPDKILPDKQTEVDVIIPKDFLTPEQEQAELDALDVLMREEALRQEQELQLLSLDSGLGLQPRDLDSDPESF